MPRTSTRRYTIWIGIGGVIALLFVVLLMVKVIRDADINAQPPEDPDATVSTDAPPSPPSEPEKPPPLNQ
jgi:hypothetical protein